MRRATRSMLRALFEDGRLDILRGIRDGHLGFLQVYDAYQRRALGELPAGDTLPTLATTMATWIASVPEYSAKHLENLETARRLFEKHKADATLADLPRVLDELRLTYGAQHPRSFNLARAAALAFVRATLKKSHPLWLAVSAVEPRKVTPSAPGQPLTPHAMLGLFPHPESDRIDAVAWGMVTTGMGSKEYWGAWEIKTDRIHVKGTKRAGRVRDVPLVRAPAVPRLSRDRFEKLFRLRLKGSVTPYDLRRTYVRWLESAGVPRTRRKLYMGHAASDVTDLYERHEIASFLVEDAQKLLAFLTPTSAKSSAIRRQRKA